MRTGGHWNSIVAIKNANGDNMFGDDLKKGQLHTLNPYLHRKWNIVRNLVWMYGDVFLKNPTNCWRLRLQPKRENVILNANIDKAPGVDGLNAGFFKACWRIVRNDVIEAIKDFFWSGKLLKQVNITSITLIPKTQRNIPLQIIDQYRSVRWYIDLYQRA